MDKGKEAPEKRKETYLAMGVALGISFGAVFGLLLGNLALGMGSGIAIGVAIGVALGDEVDSGKKDEEVNNSTFLPSYGTGDSTNQESDNHGGTAS